MADTKSTGQSNNASAQAEGGAARQTAGQTVTGAGHQLTVKKGDLTWQHGIHHVSEAHGQALTERARDLVRRALGELYQESQGGAPASTLAHNVSANLSNTSALNRLGADAATSEYCKLNQAGATQEG